MVSVIDKSERKHIAVDTKRTVFPDVKLSFNEISDNLRREINKQYAGVEKYQRKV